MAKKKKTLIPRDYHKLAMLRGEANGKTRSVPSKKAYKRNPKHKKPFY